MWNMIQLECRCWVVSCFHLWERPMPLFSRRGAMLQAPTSDRSALVAIPQGQFGSGSGKTQPGTSSGTIDRMSLQCDHCHNTGHIKDFCWKLHGRPSRGRGSGRGGQGRGPGRSQAQAHVSEFSTLSDFGSSTGVPSPSDSTGGFSQREMQALRRLMARADSSSTIAPTSTAALTASYFAHSGTGNGKGDWQW
ncbi:uncharacterized protein LOC131321722 [Rhododendron vialii]|uniref:uncharacterized protein LOC131321722 n=1 Tax=Rhododendron vialii TaxID=182163 RepID=UPI00265E1237|nr:uncharacterized protein LOC131321722 [Rhododendron vialii]